MQVHRESRCGCGSSAPPLPLPLGGMVATTWPRTRVTHRATAHTARGRQTHWLAQTAPAHGSPVARPHGPHARCLAGGCCRTGRPHRARFGPPPAIDGAVTTAKSTHGCCQTHPRAGCAARVAATRSSQTGAGVVHDRSRGEGNSRGRPSPRVGHTGTRFRATQTNGSARSCRYGIRYSKTGRWVRRAQSSAAPTRPTSASWLR